MFYTDRFFFWDVAVLSWTVGMAMMDIRSSIMDTPSQPKFLSGYHLINIKCPNDVDKAIIM